ncbi:uncharacterized protein G2W53_026305 [Senna tora]|uniref:Uncharacterized protein n=1 Tax=Senna tora TaxID=362788 RepID=A0A834WEZ3_9FABA|nr:uncharacterized protein G2W53_026305 [Senna tora]
MASLLPIIGWLRGKKKGEKLARESEEEVCVESEGGLSNRRTGNRFRDQGATNRRMEGKNSFSTLGRMTRIERKP